MNNKVNFDASKYILMEYVNKTSERTPCIIETAEFEKYQNVIKNYVELEEVPNEEVVEIYAMLKDEKDVWRKLEGSKYMEKVNEIKPTWVG